MQSVATMWPRFGPRFRLRLKRGYRINETALINAYLPGAEGAVADGNGVSDAGGGVGGVSGGGGGCGRRTKT